MTHRIAPSPEPARPVRVQLSRKKGWRMPENTVKVTRPGPFGNPFKVGAPSSSAKMAVAHFRVWLTARTEERDPAREYILDNLTRLRGKNLACWCPLGAPCHADILLELANR